MGEARVVYAVIFLYQKNYVTIISTTISLFKFFNFYLNYFLGYSQLFYCYFYSLSDKD